MVFLKFTPAMVWGLALAAAEINPAATTLVAHEWGTFTSVAGQDGRSVEWAPLTGKADLPCFVNHLGKLNVKMSMATVRMETPVLYFYAPSHMTLAVHVAFRDGWITEWYPQASSIIPTVNPLPPPVPYSLNNGEAEWQSVEVSPGETPQFPTGKGSSRYYAARQTDAAALRVGNEQEKMIFYRGVGNPAIPLRAQFAMDGSLEIRNTTAEPVPLVILFDNRQGEIGYRVTHGLKGSIRLGPPELTGSLDALRQQMADTFVEFGLYRKEAVAMLETWHDSWFEEGTRLIYILPRPAVDSLLPLKITPTPAGTVRMFVGRVELLSPWVRHTIETAMTEGDVPALTRYGRFLQPFLGEMRFDWMQQSPATQSYLSAAFNKIQQEFNGVSCVQ